MDIFPYGILEAISQNTPIAVSNIEGTSWSWDYNKCFVYETEDPTDCANAIRKALDKGRSYSNYQAIVEKYSIVHWCEQFIGEYQRILRT